MLRGHRIECDGLIGVSFLRRTLVLVDRFGRKHTSLRVSVTDRCNLRCTYCMPAETPDYCERDAILTFEEIARVVRIAVELGVDDVRLTAVNRSCVLSCTSWCQRSTRSKRAEAFLDNQRHPVSRAIACPLRCRFTERQRELGCMDEASFVEATRRPGLQRVLGCKSKPVER